MSGGDWNTESKELLNKRIPREGTRTKQTLSYSTL